MLKVTVLKHFYPFYAIINELMSVQGAVVDKKTIQSIITQLVDYSDYHFRTEDNYMIENNYLLFLSHRKEHLTYIKKMSDFIDAFEKQETTLSEDMLAFLRHWWQTHISEADLKYARYIQANPTQ